MNKSGLCLLVFSLAAALASAQSISDWTAPASWSPTRSNGGMTVQDVTPPLPFIGLAPCRIADTRGNGFGGAYGPPALAAGAPRNFALAGQCGIPAGAQAVSLNITVTQTAGPGDIRIYPQGSAAPLVSTLNYVAGETIANAAVVPLGTGGGVTIRADVSGTQLVIDANGYYASAAANQTNTFTVVNDSASAAPAILGQTNSASFNATAVKGVANSATGVTNGIWGDSVSTSDGATGVFGFAEGTSGVTTGVWGRSVSSSNESRGVYGEDLAPTGRVYGVYGFEASSFGSDSAGVRGIDNASPGRTGFSNAGIRGESVDGYGVLGVSEFIGVIGTLFDTVTEQAEGMLGFNYGGTNYGVYAYVGTIGCNGCTKQFVDPHPTDPSKTIHYVSLEGPEAGTYFRGTGRTVRGQAVIEVPDHFRWVTQEEGMTVQLTPVGDLAMMAVISQDLNRIVVRSSKDVAFHYLVQGIRPAHRNFQPVVEGGEYAPRSASDRMREGWTDWAKRRLVENGTYNADGTVNMETAERLGWTKLWAEREERARAAAVRAAAERSRD